MIRDSVQIMGHPQHPTTDGLRALVGLLPDWYDDALCAQTDPEAFYPEKGGSTREAKKVCAACPVRLKCLEFAVENGERHGIWGGVAERDRRKIRKGAA